jgi:hypothetical protein
LNSGSNNTIGAYPTLLKGREGKLNAQIIRYLALNGPSLIYSVKQDLALRSETKVHYPTINRRMHELLRQQFVQKAGKRTTKAGLPADLYATRLRGDFAALIGIPDNLGQYTFELSPKEIRQLVTAASSRQGSPFILFKHIFEEGPKGVELIDKILAPEIINGVRNGYINIDAPDEEVICSAFASVISRKMTELMGVVARPESVKTTEKQPDQVEIFSKSLDKIKLPARHSDKNKLIPKEELSAESLTSSQSYLAPVSYQWVNELKIFLRLDSVISD